MKKMIFFFLNGLWMSHGLGSPRITVGIAPAPPFIFQKEGRSLEGIYYDYIVELTKKAGYEANFEIMPLPRVLNGAGTGAFDLIVFHSGAPETQKYYFEISKLPRLHLIVVSSKKKLDLQRNTHLIGRRSGTLCPVFSSEEQKHIQFLDYESPEQATKMIAAHRIEAFCTSREFFEYEFRDSRHEGIRLHEQTRYRYEIALSLYVKRRLPPEKISLFSKTIDAMKNQKTFSGLYKKYGVPEGKDGR